MGQALTLLVMNEFKSFPGAPKARLKAPTVGAWIFVIQLLFLGFRGALKIKLKRLTPKYLYTLYFDYVQVVLKRQLLWN